MKRLPQIFILVIAFLWVLSLAVFSYHLMAHTLRLAFVGQSQQSGEKWIFLFQKPHSFFDSQILDFLDETALRDSLFLDDTPYEYLQSWSIDLSVKDGAISLVLAQPKSGNSVKISAKSYNEKSKTPYRLPTDLIWKYETKSPVLKIAPYTGTGAGLLYQIILSDYSTYTSDDITWYTSSDPSFCRENTYSWNANAFFQTKAFRRVDIQSAYPVYQIDIDSRSEVSCIVAGIENTLIALSQWDIPVFTLSGQIVAMRSPALNMQTHLRIRTESTFSKIPLQKYLDHIQITPKVPLSESNIVLADSYIDLFLPLESDKKYTLSIENINDIYGRTVSYEYDIESKDRPSLALRFQSEDTYPQFALQDEIFAQIFASGIDRTKYKIQVCKLEPSQYLRIQQHLATIKKNKIKTYNYVSMHGPWSCFQKDISANKDNIKTPFRLDSFSQNLLPSGIYMLSFADKSLLQRATDFVDPQFFTITDTRLISVPDSASVYTLFALNNRNFRPRVNEKVYLYLYHDTNESSLSKKLPRVISLGTTDSRGSLTPSAIVSQQIQDAFSSSWIYTVLVSGSESHFGFVDNPKQLFASKIPKKQDTLPQKSLLYTSQYNLAFGKSLGVYWYTNTGVILLKTSLWESVWEYEISFQKDTFFSQKISFGDHIPRWKYSIEVAQKTASWEYISLSIPVELQIWWTRNADSDAMQVSFALQSNSIESTGIPKYLRSYNNTSQNNPWYQQYLSAPISFEGIIQVSQKSPKIPLSYIDYMYNFYEIDADTNEKIQLAQWKGKTDTDGFGYIRVPVDFRSYWSDKLYLCRLALHNPITDEEVYITEQYLVSLPPQEQYFRDDVPLHLRLERAKIEQWESLEWHVFFDWESTSQVNSWSYMYALSQISNTSVESLTGVILDSSFSLDTSSLSPAVYEVAIAPASQNLPQNLKNALTSRTPLLIVGSGMTLPSDIQIIPHSTYISQNKPASVSFVSPYSQWGMIVSVQQGSAFSQTRYHTLSESVLTQTYTPLKNSTEPLCISVQVFWEEKNSSQSLCLPVSEKNEWSTQWKIGKSHFSPWEDIAYTLQSTAPSSIHHTNFFLVPSDQKENAVQWFEQFKTAWISKKAPYFPKDFEILPFSQGATFYWLHSGSLSLPNDISGNYTLIATTTSSFWHFDIQSIPITVRYPYNLHISAPKITYTSDIISAYIDITNTTESISEMTLVVKVGSWESEYRSQQNTLMNIGQKTTSRFEVPISANWKGEQDIRAYLKNWDTIIASTSQKIDLLEKRDPYILPVFDAWFLSKKTHTGTSISWSLYQSATLSVGSDIRVFLMPFLQSLQLQSSPDTTSQISTLFVDATVKNITQSLSKNTFPNTSVLHDISLVHNGTITDEWEFYHLLDELYMLAELQNAWIQVSRSYQGQITQSLKTYLELHQNNYIFADAYRVLSRLWREWADTLYEKIDTNRLDRHSRIAYIVGLQWQRKILSWALLDDAMQSVLSWSTEPQRWWSLFSDRMILLQVLINAWKQKEAQKIFAAVMWDFSNNPHIFSLREIREWARAIAIQSQKKSETSPVNWQFLAGALKIQHTLSTENPYFVSLIDTQKIGTVFHIFREKPRDAHSSYILSFSPKQYQEESDLTVTQHIEKVDIWSGMYPDNTFKKTTQILDTTLEKDALYRVTLSVQEKNPNNSSKYIINIPRISGTKAFFANTILQDSYQVPLVSYHQSATYFFGIYTPNQPTQKWGYHYYIRPLFSGKYTLPSSRIFLKSQPQTQAITQPKIFTIP